MTTPKTEMGELLTRYEWKKIEAPKRWTPKIVGEEIAGFYNGKTIRNGRFGQYEVVLIVVPRRGVFMVSGTRIVQLVDAAAIEIGWPVRVVWRGYAKLTGAADDDDEKKMKLFDFFVAEGDPVSPEDLPKIQEVAT